jgi:hypothetical protein
MSVSNESGRDRAEVGKLKGPSSSAATAREAYYVDGKKSRG